MRVLKNQDLEDNFRFRTCQTPIFPFKLLSRFNSFPNKDALSAVTKIKTATQELPGSSIFVFQMLFLLRNFPEKCLSVSEP